MSLRPVAVLKIRCAREFRIRPGSAYRFGKKDNALLPGRPMLNLVAVCDRLFNRKQYSRIDRLIPTLIGQV
jgi:hypothetical protein